MTDRRSFVGWLGTLPAALRWPRAASATPPPPGTILRATPTVLYRQPDGRSNLVRVLVTGLDAPAARARVTDRRGTLVGTAGLLPEDAGPGLAGEVWVPLAEPAQYQIDLDVGKRRVFGRRVRLVPPRRWTLYWIASSHTDLGLTDLRERCVEAHRRNLDAALARLEAHPDFRWTAECALPAVSYADNRAPAAGDALVRAIRDGKIGFTALFANLLTGLLDHETFARAALADRPVRRRAASRLRHRGGRDGAPPGRLAALGPRAGSAELPIRRSGVVGRGVRQRARGRASGRERRRVQPALRVSPAAGGAPGGFLPRRGAPLRSEAAGAAWRHRLLPRGRRGLHRAGARALPRGSARRPRGRAAGPVGRENGARGRRCVRADRAPGRAAPPDVARPAAVRGAHVGSGDERVGSRRRADYGAVGVQAALAGPRRRRRSRPGRGRAAAHRPERRRGRRARRVQRLELDAERRAARARRRGAAAWPRRP